MNIKDVKMLDKEALLECMQSYTKATPGIYVEGARSLARNVVHVFVGVKLEYTPGFSRSSIDSTTQALHAVKDAAKRASGMHICEVHNPSLYEVKTNAHGVTLMFAVGFYLMTPKDQPLPIIENSYLPVPVSIHTLQHEIDISAYTGAIVAIKTDEETVFGGIALQRIAESTAVTTLIITHRNTFIPLQALVKSLDRSNVVIQHIPGDLSVVDALDFYYSKYGYPDLVVVDDVPVSSFKESEDNAAAKALKEFMHKASTRGKEVAAVMFTERRDDSIMLTSKSHAVIDLQGPEIQVKKVHSAFIDIIKVAQK